MKIKIAQIPIEIHTVYDCLAPFCAEFMTEEAPSFCVTTTQADIAAEREKSMAECAFEGIAYPNYSPPMLENTAVYRKIAMRLPDYDALVFHGSAVAVGNQAFLFTAKSGTGKTTHTNLWLKMIPGSFVVNGDKPILRIIDEKPYVCGTPWMGKEHLGCNQCVPLAGLCILSRGAENTIHPADFSQIMHILLGQSYRPPNGAMLVKTLKILERIGNCTNLFALSCNMEDEAALVSYRGMCQ